ncbi:protein SCAI [Plutella xylostella]|uniref:protein SCAI n=1 Tax=Plutella xylostella TaxID=51655 RepID=UPI002032F660|nr:protein SCAI [Plutella xylostella]
MVGSHANLTEHERKVIIEFCHLLEKSKQLFNGLRDLPQYGHKQWYAHFGRTFDVYTKIWKYQQQHRETLDMKYGLKRWQIGEIASKIGQLYYHFYLRTSETAYLNEAYSFYYAIRGRSYYTKAVKEDRSDLMVKKLRYYARFIVVCLLLKKMKLVRELIKELVNQIVDYGNTYDPEDQMEWSVVVDEVKSFVKAEPAVMVLTDDNFPVTLSHRLTALTSAPVERSHLMTLTLEEIVIIGSRSEQVKFSELTMDMFRILQTLERESREDFLPTYDGSPRARGYPSTPGAPAARGYLDYTNNRENPHKYLLFKPSLHQVLVYLSSGCKDLPHNGALLLYISADGHFGTTSKHADDIGYDYGGVVTCSARSETGHRDRDLQREGKPSPKAKEISCLHPGDLYPFTRRPLMIIVDSENSYVFQNIPMHFGQPLVILMSPVELPSPLQDLNRSGSLFTLFLHSPLSAFCLTCEITTVSTVEWDRGQTIIERFNADASRLLTRSRSSGELEKSELIDPLFIAFMGDEFFRLLLVRYVFCEVTLRMHRAFRGRTHLPRSFPPLPEAELLDQPALMHAIWDLSALFDVRGTFPDTAPAPAAPAPSTSGATGPVPSKE